jgi:uncharacterized protein
LTDSTVTASYRLVPDCRINLDGKTLSLDRDARLTRVVVDLSVDIFGQCVLVFHDPSLALIDGNEFTAGTSVQVEMGFGHDLQQVFHGEVVALRPQFRRDLPPALEVVCQESVHRLALSSRTRSLNEVDGREIVGEIARERGFRPEGAGGTKQHLLQWNVSDAALLRRLAHEEGKHLRMEGKKLVLGPPARRVDVPITPESGLKKFKLRIAAAGQVSEVSVHGWDPKSKREIVGRAKAEGETGRGSRKHGGGATLSTGYEQVPADVAAAEAMAKGRMQKLAESFVTARIQMIGNPNVLPGAVLVLDKVDPQLDGRYRVDVAHHELDKNGYRLEAGLVWLSRQSGGKPIERKSTERAGRGEARQWRPPVALVRSRPSPADEPTTSDGLAQADVLREAAKDGAPFCEKCEAARKAAAEAAGKSAELEVKTAAGPSVELRAAPAQAAALRSAAQSGAAFCEKCQATAEARATASEAIRRSTDAQRRAILEALPPALTERQAAEAQAATLRTAAEKGTAFCEKCEAAKRALQSAGGEGN